MVEFELTEEQVVAARSEVCAEVKRRTRRHDWGEGEFRNSVFEHLMDKFDLPWKTIEVGDIPDFDDPRVKALRERLSEYYKVIDQGCSEG
jgi:hypothetical protein